MNEFSLPAAERREHERKPLRMEAHLLPPGQPRFSVRLIDISEGGLRMACSVNPPLMSVSVIRMPVPSPDRTAASLIEARVQIINSIYTQAEDGFRVGLKFLDLPAATQKIIADFLAS
jgi:c-di-GMP-binding flagellar brake protein YcgR